MLILKIDLIDNLAALRITLKGTLICCGVRNTQEHKKYEDLNLRQLQLTKGLYLTQLIGHFVAECVTKFSE